MQDLPKIAVITPYYKESIEILRRCHESVLKQTYQATHFMIADGYPREELDSWKIRHIKLPPPSVGDYGATPSCLGALEAFATGFDGILILDADNWFEPEHIATLVALQQKHQVPVITATRILRREDETVLGFSKEDGPNFTDTNCYLLMHETVPSLHAWTIKDEQNSPPDRLFWEEIVRQDYARVHSSKPTVNYLTTWAIHYLENGEQPPENAKLFVAVDNSYFIVPYYGFIPVSFRKSMQFGRGITDPAYFKDAEMQIIEEKFNQFCKNFVKPPRLDKKKLSQNSLIPPLIHFIWLGSTIPEKVLTNINSWKKFHPEWIVKIWTDKEVDHFSWSTMHSQQAFYNASNFSEKSDILRYEILYQFGGIYSDTNVVCQKPFHDLISNDITFFAGLEFNFIPKETGKALYIQSAIMGAKKESILMKFCIENYKTDLEDPQSLQELRSGPGLLSRGCEAALKTSNENILILPCSYLYPLPYNQRDLSHEKMIKSFFTMESFSMHFWEKS